MTGSITTAMCSSFKQELMEGGHCLNTTTTFTGTTANTSFDITSVSSFSNLAVGMAITGTNIAAGAVIASFVSTNEIVMSAAATGTNAGLTGTADLCYMALIIPSPTGTYGAATTNYSNVTGNSDEVASGGGYTTGGALLTNATASLSSTTAYTTYSANPSWTSATFSTAGCLVYNSSNRLGTTGRAIGVFSFGGTQEVTAGTFTVLMPSNTSSTGLLRLQ